MARPRIRQFADDMGISYDEAKKLINKGRSRRDGGAQILESYMRNAPTAPKKTKKKMNRSPGKGVTARREKEKPTRIPGTPYMADSEQMEILRRQSPTKKAMGGSQVGGMTVEQVMQTIEGDTKLGTKEFPLNREEQSQSRGGGKAIQGTKFTGVK